MNTALTYGIYLALANILLTLVGYFLGYQGENMAQGQWFQYLTWLPIIVLTTLGIRARREEDPNGALSYGRGLGTAFLVGLYGGLLGGIYTFIHFKFINPDFVDYLVEFVKSQPQMASATDQQIAAAEQGMRLIYGPAGLCIMSIIFTPLISTITGLIAAAILKRPAPAGSELPPM